MLFKLSYRNIWRNRRRTLITAASIMFAVFINIALISIESGAWQRMVDNIVHFYIGYAQVHSKGYWEEQTLDNSMELHTLDIGELKAIPGVDGLVPRLESFALASHGVQSRGALLIGVDPVAEHALTGLGDRIVEGTFLTDGGVVLARGLAEYLSASLGDSVVFLSQGFRGANAVGLYPVTGIVHFPALDFDKMLAFLPLEEAQWFYGADGRITSLVLMTDNPRRLDRTLDRLRAGLDEESFEVLDYMELMPELMEAKAVDEASTRIILWLLYLIVSFGIFGTMLMMIKERQYEFGVMKALGMKSSLLQRMFWIEMIILMFIGSLAGMALALPVVWYLSVHPIRFSGEMAAAYENWGFEAVLPALVDPQIFFSQVVVVLIMVSLIMIYPMVMLKKLKPVEAMRA